ncbi:MAG: protein kinase [Pyrinomonadaceae bacterium]
MIKCRECNSELNEAEGFCPFCGISLEPVVGADPAEEENIVEQIAIGEEIDSSILSKKDDEDVSYSDTIVTGNADLIAATAAEDHIEIPTEESDSQDAEQATASPDDESGSAEEITEADEVMEISVEAERDERSDLEETIDDASDADEVLEASDESEADQDSDFVEIDEGEQIAIQEEKESESERFAAALEEAGSDELSEEDFSAEIDRAVGEIDRKADVWTEPDDASGVVESENAQVETSEAEPDSESAVSVVEFDDVAQTDVKAPDSEPLEPHTIANIGGIKVYDVDESGDLDASESGTEEEMEVEAPDAVSDSPASVVEEDQSEEVAAAGDSAAEELAIEDDARSDAYELESRAFDAEDDSDSNDLVPALEIEENDDDRESAEDVSPEEFEATLIESESEASNVGLAAVAVEVAPESTMGEPVDAGPEEPVRSEHSEDRLAERLVDVAPPVFSEAVSDSPQESEETELPASVMDSEEPLQIENVEEPAEPSVEPINETEAGGDAPENEQDSSASEEVAASENADSGAVDTGEEKSYTTPNIGVGDTDGSKAAKLRPLDEGTVLNGRYEIVRKIGGGGMGAVYLASDKNLGGVLRAVKEMVQSYIEKEQQEKAVADFKRESMLLTSLEHPAIPTIYDYFFDESEGRFYLVMKYISGGDLAARLRSAPEGRLDELSVTQWAVEIADVLDYLHNRKPPIVYRDLKPANIMIDGNSSRIMLIDFGIARWVNKEEKGVTAVGTMGYAPPELFSGNVVASSDIYSLGSTMFHLLTGADPQNNPLLIFDFQKHPRPRQINPNLSDQIERILMRSVEYNADRRYVSAAELRSELDRHLLNLRTGKVTYGVSESPQSVSLSDQPVFCGFCGQKIVATDMFCAFCGAKQPLAQPGVHSQEYHLPTTTAKLMVEGTGDLNVPTFDLGKKENLVGRRDPMSNIFPEVDLSKFDPQTKVSRKHARIWREGDGFMVEDLGSSNGTLLLHGTDQTMRLSPHQPQMLRNGDRIQLGDTTLHFVVG